MGVVSRWADKIVAETHLPWQHKGDNYENDKYELESEAQRKHRKGMGKYWPIVTAGAGLFSDGYVNNSIGSVGTCLSLLYPKQYANSPAQSNVASIAFVGTVLGQLFFGYVADYHSRKIGMLLSTAILILFTILGAGAWGAHDSVYGMLAALTAYRFFIGIGIGGEYPAGSVAASEATAVLSKGHRNRWFVLFTNFMIDFGFVVSAFVPLVCLWIFGMDHLTAVWRLTLGLGAIPPISLFFLRLKFKEPEQFTKNNFKRTKVPYLLVIKYYGPRLIVVSLIWFIYDFSVYSFGIYSSTILNIIIPDGNLYKTFGWNTVINLFYMPGAFLGAFASDYLGPRLTLVVGVSLQAIVGYIMASQYENLSHHVASFVVVYGIFLSLGEFGPGDQIGTICSKTSASSIRGQYYGTAAAVGKIGAFIGTKTFPYIIKHFGGPDSVKGNQAPFWISSSLCLFSACLALFCLPSLGQDQIMVEDEKFRDYLTSNGFDTSLMGDLSSIDAVDSNKSYDEADVTREEDVYIEKS